MACENGFFSTLPPPPLVWVYLETTQLHCNLMLQTMVLKITISVVDPAKGIKVKGKYRS